MLTYNVIRPQIKSHIVHLPPSHQNNLEASNFSFYYLDRSGHICHRPLGILKNNKLNYFIISSKCKKRNILNWLLHTAEKI